MLSPYLVRWRQRWAVLGTSTHTSRWARVARSRLLLPIIGAVMTIGWLCSLMTLLHLSNVIPAKCKIGRTLGDQGCIVKERLVKIVLWVAFLCHWKLLIDWLLRVFRSPAKSRRCACRIWSIRRILPWPSFPLFLLWCGWATIRPIRILEEWHSLFAFDSWS